MMHNYYVPCMDCGQHHEGDCGKTIRRNIYAAISLAACILIVAVALAGSIQGSVQW